MRLIWRFLAVCGVFFLAYGVISLITGTILGTDIVKMVSFATTTANGILILFCSWGNWRRA